MPDEIKDAVASLAAAYNRTRDRLFCELLGLPERELPEAIDAVVKPLLAQGYRLISVRPEQMGHSGNCSTEELVELIRAGIGGELLDWRVIRFEGLDGVDRVHEVLCLVKGGDDA